MTTKLIKLKDDLFDFLSLEPIEVIYENLELEDSRFYTHELYIAINKNYLNDEYESMKCLIHEIRHYYQLTVVTLDIEAEPQYKYWKEEFNIKLKPEDEMCKYIEIDAFAFTKYILKEWFAIEYHHYDKKYDEILDLFIYKFY